MKADQFIPLPKDIVKYIHGFLPFYDALDFRLVTKEYSDIINVNLRYELRKDTKIIPSVFNNIKKISYKFNINNKIACLRNLKNLINIRSQYSLIDIIKELPHLYNAEVIGPYNAININNLHLFKNINTFTFCENITIDERIFDFPNIKNINLAYINCNMLRESFINKLRNCDKIRLYFCPGQLITFGDFTNVYTLFTKSDAFYEANIKYYTLFEHIQNLRTNCFSILNIRLIFPELRAGMLKKLELNSGTVNKHIIPLIRYVTHLTISEKCFITGKHLLSFRNLKYLKISSLSGVRFDGIDDSIIIKFKDLEVLILETYVGITNIGIIGLKKLKTLYSSDIRNKINRGILNDMPQLRVLGYNVKMGITKEVRAAFPMVRFNRV